MKRSAPAVLSLAAARAVFSLFAGPVTVLVLALACGDGNRHMPTAPGGASLALTGEDGDIGVLTHDPDRSILDVTSNAFTGIRGAKEPGCICGSRTSFTVPIADLVGRAMVGEVVHLGRGCAASSALGISEDDPYPANPSGKIALIERGMCNFDQKVARAQLAGATGVIIYNSVAGGEDLSLGWGGDNPVPMPDGAVVTVAIPAVLVQRSTGLLLRDGAPPVTVRVEAPSPNATPVGEDVPVMPTDQTTGQQSPVGVTFPSVTGSGATTVASGTVGAGGGPPAPANFRLGSPPTYYDIQTTATYTSPVKVCVSWVEGAYGSDQREKNLKLLHWTGTSWEDVTISPDYPDVVNNVICGLSSSLSPFLVGEQNLAPVVSSVALPGALAAVLTSVAIGASFTDGNPGDKHTATIAWDDGMSSAGTVSEAHGAGTVSASHTYAVAGVYTVTVTVNDNPLTGSRSSALDVPAYIVVYDPSGGFVTGGGWITSPAGACAASLCSYAGEGKATFGFVSRYLPGAMRLGGSTEFQFKAGNLSFSSARYDWLVVAGARAQYMGEGAINGGTAVYGFLLTAIDGQVAGGGGTDRFRIKIWDKATGRVVYDNQLGAAEDGDAATTLGGGSVVIHKG